MATKGGVHLRNRCAILLHYTAGLRNFTMRTLRWDDFPDLDTCEDRPLKASRLKTGRPSNLISSEKHTK